MADFPTANQTLHGFQITTQTQAPSGDNDIFPLTPEPNQTVHFFGRAYRHPRNQTHLPYPMTSVSGGYPETIAFGQLRPSVQHHIGSLQEQELDQGDIQHGLAINPPFQLARTTERTNNP